MCSDRVAVNQAPACAKVCPTGAIQFGAKEDMKDYADKRIADLRNAASTRPGLYDPAGVGGTHVMYVLHHADQPKLYANLPDQSGISPLVSLWKGRQALATLALAGVALGSLFHYVTKGPERGLEGDRKGTRLNCPLPKTRRPPNDPGDPKDLQRYNASERANHWVGASASSCWPCPAWPSSTRRSSPLTQLFGGGGLGRILHPFIGVLMALSFLGLFLRFRHLNKMTPADKEWLARGGEMVNGDDHNMPNRANTTAARKPCSGLALHAAAVRCRASDLACLLRP